MQRKKIQRYALAGIDWNEPAINFYKKYGSVNFDGEWVNCSVEMC